MLGNQWASRVWQKRRLIIPNVAVFLVFLVVGFCYGVLVLKAPTPDSYAAPLMETIEPAVAVRLSEDLVLFGSATDGSVRTGSYKAYTSINSPRGYTLSLNMVDENTCMRHVSEQATACSAVADNKKLLAGTLTDVRQWSWSVDGGVTWVAPQGASGTDALITKTAGPYADDEQEITIGTRTDGGMYSGGYFGTVMTTVVANAEPAPTITNVYLSGTTSAAAGPPAGGTAIDIVGNYLDTAYEVFVDLDADGVQDAGEACTEANIVSGNKLTCVTPAGTAGAKNVVVKTWGGVATRTGGFTYELKPVVSKICRAGETCAGNTSSGHFMGGETFTITGENFTGATAVALGGSACHSFAVVSDTQITCVSAGEATVQSTSAPMTVASKTVSVRVTTAEGASAANTLFSYRYPNASYATHGTYLHILGASIENGSKFTVGGTNCDNLVISGATRASCVAPAKTAGTQATLAAVEPPASQGNMQNWSGCSSIATPAYTTTDWTAYTRVLTDTRDGKKYRIRKLPDGNCWMIDNLKLGGTGSTITLTSSNSNVSSNFVLPANAVTTAAQRATNGRCDGATVSGTGEYLTCDGTNSATTNSNLNLHFAAYADPSSTNNSYYENCQSGAPGLSSDSLSGCGYLYNWYTATAGTGTYSINTDGTNVASSLCPAGWRLPKAGTGTAATNNDFAVLNAKMSNGSSTPSVTSSAATRANWRASGAFSGSYSGYWLNVFNNQGSSGVYWSASANSATDARSLTFLYSRVYPGSVFSSKYYGYAIRCML